MPKIKSKVIRVRNPETNEWNDLPAVVSMESLRAAERAAVSAEAAAVSAEAAAESTEAAAESAETAAESAEAAVEAEGKIDKLIKDIMTEVPVEFEWIQGNINYSGANTNVNQSIRVRIRYYQETKGGVKIVVPNGMKMLVHLYSADGRPATGENYIGHSEWLTGTVIIDEAPWFRVVIGYEDDSAITIADIANIVITRLEVMTETETDTTVSISGKPADAKATGDLIATGDSWERWRQTISEATSGHVMSYFSKNRPFKSYKKVGDDIIEDGVVYGTDFIPCQSGDIISLALGNSSTVAAGKHYIYFYNANKEPDWTILCEVDDQTGEINKFTNQSLNELNGSQFTGVPAGYYMRVASAAGVDDVRVFVWDGIACGLPLTFQYFGYDDLDNFVSCPSDGSSTTSILGNVYAVIAKPGYTITDIATYGNGTRTRRTNARMAPTQCMATRPLGSPDLAKDITVVKGYNYSTKEHERVTSTNDISGQFCVIPYTTTSTGGVYYVASPPGGQAHYALEKTNDLMNFTWECKRNVNNWSPNTIFKQGVTYNGVPWRSGWLESHFVGWHLTKHTFLNAVNDPDSVFYTQIYSTKGKLMGAYYGFVCSAFGTLAGGFQAPHTNFDLTHNPLVYMTRTSEPELGTPVTNGVGHCILPIKRIYRGDGNQKSVLQIAEASGHLRFMNCYDAIGSDDDIGPGGASSFFLRNYQFSCKPKYWSLDTPYNISDGTVRNGSARPHRGDQSVYTSNMDVIINVKDENADRLYYQKYNVTVTRGRISSSSSDGSPMYVEIPADTPTTDYGSRQITLRGKTEDNAHTGVELEDGAVYAVWASEGDAQTTAPSNREYFEWHDLEPMKANLIYDVVNGVLVTDSEFWYAAVSGWNYNDPPMENSHQNGHYNIVYQAPGKAMDGTQLEHSDYSNYADYIYIKSRDGVFGFFFKGKFGAYYMPKSLTDDIPDDEDPEDDDDSGDGE